MLIPTLFIFAVLACSIRSSTGHNGGGPTKKLKVMNGCDIGTTLRNKDNENIPLVLSENFDSILYPPTMLIDHNTKIGIACPELHLFIANKLTYLTSMSILCYDGGFDIPQFNSRNVKFSDLRCKAITDARPAAKIEPYNTGTAIGYQVQDKAPFLPFITITHTALGFYTCHKLPQAIAQGGVYTRPDFKMGTCKINDKSAASFYEKKNQQITINGIFNLTKTDDKYISVQDTSEKYLARGHLAPASDFVYPADCCGTFFLDNAAPQWQMINNANWKQVEIYVQKIAESHGDLTVYTGTHEISTIKGQRLYLAPKQQLPVPKYYWKIVHDSNNATVAFVTLNNPHEGNMVSEQTSGLFQFCKGSCQQLKFLNSTERENLKRGLTECCQVKPPLLTSLNMQNIASKGLLKL